MSPDSPIRVLIHTRDAGLRARAAAALESCEFHVSRRLPNPSQPLPSDQNAWQVLVTDHPADELLTQPAAGQGTFATITLGDTPPADLQLPADFTARELQIAVTLGARIAGLRAERNELLEAHSAVRELAETDPLTGLPNRRAWQRRVPTLLARAQRVAEPAWLALLDLDRFKEINDREGMSQGDRVLSQCAHALSAALRRDDLVARLGGDEFGVLLVGVSDDRVLEIFERLRDSVAAGGSVTASIGLVEVAPGGDLLALQIVAEVALRRAKRQGGNRVERST